MTGLLAFLMGLFVAIQAASVNVEEIDCKTKTCDVYRPVKLAFRECRNRIRGDTMHPNYISEEITKTCRNAEYIKTCMKMKLGSCPNWSDINRRLVASLDNCENGDLPGPFKKFLTENKQAYVTDTCCRKVVKEIDDHPEVCNQAIRPKSLSTNYKTLADAIDAKKGCFRWYISCFNNMTLDMNEKLPECNNISRHTVYSLMMASTQVDQVFGFMIFPEVQSFIAEPQGYDLLQQIEDIQEARRYVWPF